LGAGSRVDSLRIGESIALAKTTSRAELNRNAGVPGGIGMWPFRNIKWFSCAQFDEIAKTVGVELRADQRYRLSSSRFAYASSQPKKGFITFGQKWFRPLSERAKAAVLVHELWHSKNFDRMMKGRKRVRIVFFASGIPGLLLWVFLLTRIPPHTAAVIFVVAGVFFASLGALVWGAVFGVAGGFVYRRYSWPIEFECDEAAVRFIGPAGTLEYLGALKLRSNRQSHPPSKIRQERIEEFVGRYPIPEIEFSTLQAEIPQVFDPPM
jgi:Zn-dependent protease with chaperone function